MPDRLSSLDASFLYSEDATTPMHVGTVMIFDPPKGGFDYEELLDLVHNRIAYVPRHRQRVQPVPGGLANPVWVDDEHFDISYHVRRSALPKPGTPEQLAEFVGRVQARQLDRSRPLWELYLVEGLEGGRFALVTKTHEALVDGLSAVDLGQVLVGPGPSSTEPVHDTWRPDATPSSADLLADAAWSMVRSPRQMVTDTVTILADVKGVSRRLTGTAAGLVSLLARSAAKPAPSSPLNTVVGAYRRYAMVEANLADYQQVRSAILTGHDTDHVTVNDVVLATVAGALREWLMARGQGVNTGDVVRALVPVTIHTDGSAEEVTACYVDLPVGEPRPRMRLHQIAYEMQQQVESRAAVGARSLSALSGFAPPTLHSLGARAGSAMSRRMSNLVITNVPGPQHDLFVGQARMVASYPVIPLPRGQALTIGLTSYHGRVYFGLNADRDAMPDVDMLGECLQQALAELLEDCKVTR
ncbi:wax ester/triacylglycerol synthase family O-acyltransferase [Calidifontibacter sp. DB0510]|uniref:Diacylglycerol O-acyltransferase n=1 Tax=Metallococcus carri TaxID=1656884 RepID=A0A967E8U3_9MICO|nr:wax ester/triacylglycerol synthase family O-acyltransferase [Metallococcus carri]NHN54540.1 wax ester/triacylglycerol synthase family O-acyltransferase [Metallococcus carri]NOP36621.1 wax ester/triacylglycerol synthase family O-acyltransferase [Calidifontibacter sp. DB2511S]